MKLYHGDIITCDKEDHVYQYLVEHHGKIVFVGDQLPVKYEKLVCEELGDKVLLPSFCDSHLHFASMALFQTGLNVMNAKSNEEIKEKLVQFLPTTKAKIVIAFGASPYSVKEGCLLSREDLDEVSISRPIMVVKYDGHACIVNSKLLEMLPENISLKAGYHKDSGEMNQDAFFATTDFVTSKISIPSLVKSMQKAIDFLAEKGIGMIHTVSGVGFPGDLDVDMERYVGRGAERGFQLRLFFQTMDIKKVLKRKLPRIGGCFQTALDGCFGSVDAALVSPYQNSSNVGVLYYSDQQVIDFCKQANRQGLQIELHAIGDAAFNQATKAIQAALQDFPRTDHRHGIIHACLPTAEGLERCRDYNITIPLQTSFLNWPQEPDWYLQQILGERERKLNPLKTFLDYQIVISAGSDAPCTDPDPMLWIHNACNHPVEEQAISLKDALKMATYNGYWTTFDEKERGSLEIGKYADMVVLEKNPFLVEKQELKNIKVLQLLLKGKAYQKQKHSWLGLIISGALQTRKPQ